MRFYYRHAREIAHAALRAIETVDEQSSSLLLQFRDWRSRVSNAEFHVSRERVYFRAPHRLEHDPGMTCGSSISWDGTDCGSRSRPSAASRSTSRASAVLAPRAAGFGLAGCGRAARDTALRARAAGDAAGRGPLAAFPGVGRVSSAWCSRLLSSLHGGRAHAARDRDPDGPATTRDHDRARLAGDSIRRWTTRACSPSPCFFTTPERPYARPPRVESIKPRRPGHDAYRRAGGKAARGPRAYRRPPGSCRRS